MPSAAALDEHDTLLRAARAVWAAGTGLREDYMTHRLHVGRAIAQAATWRGRRLKLRYRGDRRRAMHEICDRCGPVVQARYRADRLGELFLCRHCAMRLWPTLAAQGWTLWLIGEPKFATSAR